MSDSKVKKIVVLGGGMGSLSTVWYLTNRDDWQDYYQIDVYQMGWRLGGKGASGREVGAADRILEHGIHMMFGFYDNALDLLHGLYDELGRGGDDPMATFDEAFIGQGVLSLTDELATDPNEPFWNFYAPQLLSRPGESPRAASLIGMLKTMGKQLENMASKSVSEAAFGGPTVGHAMDGLLGSHAPVIDPKHWAEVMLGHPLPDLNPLHMLKRELAPLESHVLGSLLRKISDGVAALGLTAPGETTATGRGVVVGLLTTLQKFVDSALYWTLKHGWQNSRRVLQVLSLGIAIVKGVLTSFPNLWAPDWFSIDDQTFESWLISNNCPKIVANSCLTQVLRQVGFAGPQGSGAGSTLHWAMRMVLDYRGWFMYKMAAGMGDIIFAPLYEVLKKRGVRFHFFHRVDALRHVDGEISQIEMGQPVTVKDAANGDPGEYQPLVDIAQQSGGNLPCWPDRPLFDQLTEGQQLKGCWNQDAIAADLENWWTSWPDQGPAVVLKSGVDYDFVVLGIAVGALSEICQDLCNDANNPLFGEMVAGVQTAQTQAFQFWLTPTTKGLGFDQGDVDSSAFGPFSPVLGTYSASFDTWADMSQVISSENWSSYDKKHQPQSLAYWCAFMDDGRVPLPTKREPSQYLHQQLDRCLARLTDWSTHHAMPVWPNSVVQTDESVQVDAFPTGEFALFDDTDDTDEVDGPANPMDLELLVSPPPALIGNWPKCPYSPAPAYNDPDLVGRLNSAKGVIRALKSQYYRVPYNPSERYVLTVPGSTSKRLPAWGSGYRNLFMTGDWTLNPISAGCIEATVQSGAMCAQALAGTPTTIVDYWLFEQPPPPAIWMPPANKYEEPNYIPAMANELPAPPYAAHNATVDVFVLPADLATLQAACDSMLNLAGSDHVFKPIAPMVMFVAATIEVFTTGQPVATSPERDFGFWIPVFKGTEDESGKFTATGFAFYLPMLWVDPPLAVRAGREIFGYQKSAGKLTGVNLDGTWNPGEANHWSVTGYVTSGAPGTTPAYAWDEIVRVDPGSGEWWASKDLGLIEMVSEIFEELAETAEGNLSSSKSLIGQLMREAGGLQFPMVYLKQFRSASSSQKACYQGIIWSQNNVTSGLAFKRLQGPFTLQATAYDSCDAATALGLPVDGDGKLDVLLAASVTFDFTAALGEELFVVGKPLKPVV